MARFYLFLNQILFFSVRTGVKMHILNQKTNICTLVGQNKGYLCKKNMNSLLEKDETFLPACEVLPFKRPENNWFLSGAIHRENSIWNIQIFALNLYELKYLREPFWKICSTRPQNFGGLKGKGKKKAWLYVKFSVSYQLFLQICKESETEPKF